MHVMATAWPLAQVKAATRDHGFHQLRIARVVCETAEAKSFVLEVPSGLEPAFSYEAGEFCTFRVWIDGQPHFRSYSMSSSPAVDGELQVTVKRVPGGVVSNWMTENLSAGDVVETSCPAGVFCLSKDDGDVVAFAAGSGITPVFSIVKSALATTSRRVSLFYANRDLDSIIFAADLDHLVQRHPGRLEVVHHLDVERGFVTADAIRPFASTAAAPEYFVCGPAPFMEIVENALVGRDVADERIHIERFSPPEQRPLPESSIAASTTTQVTIELGGRTDTVDHHPGATILQTARQMGMSPPSSCESGSCATCMARIVQGGVNMHVNDALTDDEVADGWVLTCQSVPSTPSVRICYEEG
jgi:ferredoxin-NADP reductase